MPRTARHKSKEAAFYHLTNRVTGWTDWFPFEDRRARRKLLDMMLFYVSEKEGDSLLFWNGRGRSDDKGAGSFGCHDDLGGHLVELPRLLPETRDVLVFVRFRRLSWF